MENQAKFSIVERNGKKIAVLEIPIDSITPRTFKGRKDGQEREILVVSEARFQPLTAPIGGGYEASLKYGLNVRKEGGQVRTDKPFTLADLMAGKAATAAAAKS